MAIHATKLWSAFRSFISAECSPSQMPTSVNAVHCNYLSNLAKVELIKYRVYFQHIAVQWFSQLVISKGHSAIVLYRSNLINSSGTMRSLRPLVSRPSQGPVVVTMPSSAKWPGCQMTSRSEGTQLPSQPICRWLAYR